MAITLKTLQMKKLITLSFIAISTVAYGQQIVDLSISNPQPRIGEEVSLSIDMEFIANDMFFQLPDGVKGVGSSSIYGKPSTLFSQKVVFKNTGEMYVGPFNFTYNGKKYVTDSIKVNVVDGLPFEEGIWVTYVSEGGENYIIVEQQIENESDYREVKGGYTYTVGGVLDDKTEFAEIEELPEEGVQCVLLSAVIKTRTEPGKKKQEPGLSYSYQKYKVSYNEYYKGTFILEEEHFNNFPKRTEIRVN